MNANNHKVNNDATSSAIISHNNTMSKERQQQCDNDNNNIGNRNNGWNNNDDTTTENDASNQLKNLEETHFFLILAHVIYLLSLNHFFFIVDYFVHCLPDPVAYSTIYYKNIHQRTPSQSCFSSYPFVLHHPSTFHCIHFHCIWLRPIRAAYHSSIDPRTSLCKQISWNLFHFFCLCKSISCIYFHSQIPPCPHHGFCYP